MPCAQKQFFPFLEQNFPSIAERYKARYERHPYLRGDYATMIQQRVRRARKKCGLASSPAPYEPEALEPDPQLRLFS